MIPHGWYAVRLVGADPHVSQKGTPTLRLTYEIADGDYAGAKIFEYVVKNHANKSAVALGQAIIDNVTRLVGNNNQRIRY